MPPSLPEKALNFAKAAAKYAASGCKNVSTDEYVRRLEICASCEKLDAKSMSCNECGCYVKLKCLWATENCKNWEKSACKPSGI